MRERLAVGAGVCFFVAAEVEKGWERTLALTAYPILSYPILLKAKQCFPYGYVQNAWDRNGTWGLQSWGLTVTGKPCLLGNRPPAEYRYLVVCPGVPWPGPLPLLDHGSSALGRQMFHDHRKTCKPPAK
ncbi:hypothetical protein LY76DRAFT_587113 [Colletotrichum caudatum]|nr:hypothetical protein LY76DRAFT_587113 [Colletotrichum caudatum]